MLRVRVAVDMNRCEYKRLKFELQREQMKKTWQMQRVAPTLIRASTEQQTDNDDMDFPPLRRRRFPPTADSWQSSPPARMPSSPGEQYYDSSTNVDSDDIEEGHEHVNMFINNEQLPDRVTVTRMRSDVYRLIDYRPPVVRNRSYLRLSVVNNVIVID